MPDDALTWHPRETFRPIPASVPSARYILLFCTLPLQTYRGLSRARIFGCGSDDTTGERASVSAGIQLVRG